MILKGEFHPDFGQVAESLIRNIERHSPGGAALCIYHHGEKVVDVWGGTRDVYGTPWESDTVAFSASSTKAVPSTLLHILVDQGKARYDDRVVNFPMGWRMGYHQVYSLGPRSPEAFGHFGFGGSGGWCDPSRELSLAMTLNTCIGTGLGELRFALISGDVLRCADRRERWRASA